MESRSDAGPIAADGAPAALYDGRLERALALTTPDESHRIRKDAPAAALVAFAIARRVLDLLHFEVLIRLRSDAEDVHRARSTVRRLRAVLRGFRPSLDRAWADTLREELRWLAGELASVRDLDVTLLALTSRGDALKQGGGAYLSDVLEPLREAARTARAGLLETLDGARYRALLRGLESAATRPRFGAGAPPCAAALARRTLRKAARRVRKAVRAARPTGASSELHHARIVVRNERYVAEACAYVVQKPALRLASRLARMQDALGAIGDARLIQERLRELVVPERAKAVIEELLLLEATGSEAARRKWATLRGKALSKQWLRV
jgi:CHAD domain-containing protein